MRLSCPFCGSRDASEFAYRGDASPRRPDTSDPQAFADYVYLRDNPAGPIDEHWYHAIGCRRWIVVRRDTRSHDIGSIVLAKGAAL